MLFIGLRGASLSAQETSYLHHPFVAGVVLFSRNYTSPPQLSALTAAIRHENPELLICVDHEGGRVQRFREGFTVLPEMAAFGCVYDDDPTLAARLAECAGNIMGYELRRHDIDFSLAPVLDLQDDCSSVIGNRAFHHDPYTVITLANALRRGLRHQGMAAVGKHYPGHGRVTGDSHHMLPCDHRPFADRAADRTPFIASIADGIEGIMAAHIMLPEDTLPAGFSRPCLQTLRDAGFQGAILSDDLDMQGALAISAEPVSRVQLALDAGADAAMICNNFADIAAVLAANLTPDPAKQARLAALRARPASPDAAAYYQHACAQLAGHHPQLY